MKQLTILLAFCCLMAACNDGANESEERKDGFSETAKTPEDSLYKLVMEGHDIGMAKMGKLRGLQQQAQRSLDSLNKLSSSENKAQWQQMLMDIQEDLNYAEYSMNTWMEEFNSDSAKDNPELRLEYLKTEQDKVEKVKNNILSSIQRADSIFKK